MAVVKIGKSLKRTVGARRGSHVHFSRYSACDPSNVSKEKTQTGVGGYDRISERQHQDREKASNGWYPELQARGSQSLGVAVLLHCMSVIN